MRDLSSIFPPDLGGSLQVASAASLSLNSRVSFFESPTYVPELSR